MNTKKLSLWASVTMLAVCLVGCASGGGGLPWKPIVYETNSVPVVVEMPAATNSVAVPAVFDAAGMMVKAEGRVDVVTPARLLTNWVTQVTVNPNPIWTKGIAGAQAANTLNPTPSAPFIQYGLGLLTVGLGALARVLQKRVNEKTDLLHTVIAGVEQIASPEMKAKITEYAEVKKHYDELRAQVKAVTAT